jgi:hypothetical protein
MKPFPSRRIPIPPSWRTALRRLADEYGAIAVGAAALVWLALEGGGYGGVARHLAGVVVWLFVFGLLMVRGTAALPRGPVLVVAGAMLAFATLTGLSVLWSESVGRSYDELTRVLTYLGVFVAVAAVGANPRRRDQLLEGLTLGMAAVIVLALLSRLEPGLFPDQPLGRFAPEFRPRLAYPFGYWNAVGSFAAVGIVLLVHAASRADRGPRYRAAATALLPAAGLVLYLTYSRGSIVAAGAGCALILLLSPRRLAAFGSMAIGVAGAAVLVALVSTYHALNDGLIDQSDARSQGHRVLAALVVVSALAYAARLLAERSPLPRRIADAAWPQRRKLFAAAAVVLVAATAVAAPKIANRIAEFDDPVVTHGVTTTDRVESRLTSGSANGRYQFWSSSWDAWKSKPVAGRGAGTWEFWWRRHATINAPTRDSHSLAFDVLAELGTLGVGALIALFGTALWIAFAAARHATGQARAALVAIAAAAVAWTIGAGIDWFWEFAALGVVLMALLALAASARRDQLGPAAAAGSGERRAIVGGLALAAWVVVVVQGVALAGAWSLQRSEDAVVSKHLKDAESAAKLARSVEPWASEPYMQLALVQVRQGKYDQAIATARKAVDREPTNWRTWLVLTRVEARSGRLGDAAVHSGDVARLAKGSPLVPTYEQLRAISESKDLSLSPEP